MSATELLLRVALPVPLPRLFDYLPPAGHTVDAGWVGCRVQVPFGPRSLVGVVAEVGSTERSPAEASPAETGPALRAAEARLDATPLLRGELLESLRWLARYTHAPLGETLSTALPAALRRGEPLPDTRRWGWRATEAGRTAAARLRGRPARLMALLTAQPVAAGQAVAGEDAAVESAAADGATAVDEDRLDLHMEDWRSAARALRSRGLAERIPLDAGSHAAAMPAGQPGPELNPEQAAALAAVRAADGFQVLLLEGVTGSGKTEVYLHAIADCLARGRQALVLVPEIGLTPQTLHRFRTRLGVPVQVLHSGLADGERARGWAAAARGEARVLLGTRSAVFAPLPEAGLIVIDEEHDASYKQQDGIRYHARDFALIRARALGVPVLLGSATPALETLHNARNQRYAHLTLRQRAGNARPPTVRVQDVRKRPLEAGLSADTLVAIRRALDAGGQVLVFKNRRGYAPVLQCHDCGWSAGCRRCGTPEKPSPLTVHGGGRRLQCHHCGARQPAPAACPDCASLALQPQGVGTERLEALLAERFTDVPVLRIDSTSTRRKDALEQRFAELGAQPGILIGTQMLAKGHDLPHLTLVVVVGIDEGLFSADFRAGEKLAQLLIQVAGRAGRAEKPGDVLLQTHHPEHPLLHTLIQGGYRAFADTELTLRRAAGFPPFAHLALLRAEAAHADAAIQPLHIAKAAVTAWQRRHEDHIRVESMPVESMGAESMRDDGTRDAAPRVQAHGPLPAPMPKRAGAYRTQLLLGAARRSDLHAALDAALAALYAAPEARRARWSVDVDPVDLY